jgi:hypothetical protein
MPDASGAYSSYPTVTNKLMPPPDQMQSLGQTVGVANGIQALSQSQFDLAHKQLGAVNSLMAGIAQDPSDQNIAQAAAAARNLGIPANVIAQEVSSLSAMKPPERTQYAIQHISRNMDAAGQIAASTGSPQTVNDGDVTRNVLNNPIKGTVTPMAGSAAVIPNQVGPAGRMERQSAVGPGGVAVSIPNSTLYDNRGNPRTAAPAGPAMSSAAGGIPGALPTSQAPGVAEAQTKTAAAGAEQGINLQRSADGVPTRKAMFAQLETDLDQFTAGPGADWQNVAKAWANRNVLPGSMQFDPKSIASQEQFNKQAVMVAQQQFQALGGTGTDSQLSSTMKTSPNAALSEMGNRGIIQLLKGNEDAIDAKNQAWQKWKTQYGADSYDKFSTKFNQVYNPLVFQTQYMSHDEITNLQKKLSPKDAQKFAQSYAVAKSQGWIGGGNGGQ